jgi:Macrocin-O-methyltransferase (TylF)
MSVQAADLYLDLLKRSLTATLFSSEPDHDQESQAKFLRGFIAHYIRGTALTMLPTVRLNHLQSCIIDVINRSIPGDVIETGVWRGGATIFMRGIFKIFDVRDRAVWVADSFEGLPVPDGDRFPLEAKAHAGPFMTKVCNHLAVGLDEVKGNFAAYGLLDDQVHFLKGWFSETLPGAPIERLALMRLDGDLYDSTRDALVNLYDRLSPGGYVIIDDYGEDSWTYCRRAVDEFRTERDISDPLIKVDSRCYYWQRTAEA